MKPGFAVKHIGQLVLSFYEVAAGGAPRGPFTLQAVTHGDQAWLDGEPMCHPVSDLVLNETWPVDFDSREDPDCPKTPGDAVISALSHLGLPEVADGPTADGDAVVLIWNQDSADKIRQRLLDMGWAITRTRPWKK